MLQSRWHALMKNTNAHLVYYGEYVADVATGTRLIVGDPNVRSLSISISVRTVSKPTGMIGLEAVTGQPALCFSAIGNLQQQNGTVIYPPLQRYVQSLMYEFNEKHSDQLVPFYNPVDPAQQAQFKKVMANYLDAPLAKAGAELVSASFTVND